MSRDVINDIEDALELARRYGQIEGDHHRAWVIDQMVRALTQGEYDAWVRDACDGGYEWDCGIAP